MTEEAGDAEILASDDAGEVLLFQDEFGILVQGSPESTQVVIDRLLRDVDPNERATSRMSLQDVAAVGATGVALAASSGEYLRLSADSLSKVQTFGAQVDNAGALRGYVRDGGRFAGQLSFEPVSLAAEQALAIQTAAVSLALRSAIANVQKAVERVEATVDSIQGHLQDRLKGDVIGTYRNLQRVTDATNARGRLLEADWQGVAGVRNQLYRDLETLRAAVAREAGKLGTGSSVPKRASRLEEFHEPGDLVDMLGLILVAEQSLQLHEYLRLQQVRRGDPEYVASALTEARDSLIEQQRLDEELVDTLVKSIERVRRVDPLETHHILSKDKLDLQARRLHAEVADFSRASRLRELPELDVMPAATFADTRDEIRGRAAAAGGAVRTLGGVAATGGASLFRRGSERARFRKTAVEDQPETDDGEEQQPS